MPAPTTSTSKCSLDCAETVVRAAISFMPQPSFSFPRPQPAERATAVQSTTPIRLMGLL